MKQFVNFGTVMLTMAIVVASLTTIIPASANARQVDAVTVVNTPLPVTGNVSATLAGNVNATLTGPVNLAPNTLVRIENVAQDPVLIRDAGRRQPWHAFDFNDSHCNGTICVADVGTVPAGYRLVVEHVSGELRLLNGAQITSVVIGRAYLSNGLTSIDDYPVPQKLNDFGFFTLNYQTLMFFDAGDTIRLLVHTSTDSAGTVNFTTSGYLIEN